ncbi:recombinase RecD [Chloroflexus islandicus]|uniref:ATP-dependent RecD2 DNA helicase n=1 Tax=Chloroflexus islandicus TaxID=1707952 RepID=A0A178MC70_9CHLR|nr:ATP-dependent RecD-like DNA helicase [Chloroflexus islandicus]OAN46126.1 recombinase RecD [Chloroflexus islandicus]
MPQLDGILERITYQSESTGYTVAQLRPAGKRDTVTIVGQLLGVQPGEQLILEGEWRDHPTHGRQFSVQRYHTRLPATIDGIRRYLGSGLIKGVGPATAKRITETFGKYTLDVLDREPERLREVPGLGHKKAEQIAAAWREQQRIKDLMLLLQDLGLPTGVAVRIYKHYGDDALAVVQHEPYRLADEVDGVGFRTADAIAAGLGIARDDPRRIAAGVRFALGQASDDGHCYLPWRELIERAASLLTVAATKVQAVVDQMLAAGQLWRDPVVTAATPAEQPIYLPPLAFAEIGVANAIRRWLAQRSALASHYAPSRWELVFAHLAERRGIDLSPQQRAAVRTALTSPVMLLTGGPGTGKTTSLRALVLLLRARGYRPLLAAPTGRAARRLSEATGIEARTIHRLLEYSPDGTFRRNADNPLACDLLVIDEASMLDVVLANQLLKATPLNAHVVIVGDADQLPSVGPGRVLGDLIDSGIVPRIHLDAIFRQAAGSGIAANARRINDGLLPEWGGHDDFYFFAAETPERCAELVVELVVERIPRRFGYDPRRDIQVLSPTHKGNAGVAALNTALQAALNPPRPGVAEYRSGATVFRVGDRVIQQRNDYDRDVYNGDTGEIIAIDAAAPTVVVRFEDGRAIRYSGLDLDDLALAYALSVHKSQGSEYPVVVLPLLLQHQPLLQRNLLYTAVTRARQLVVIVGDRRAVAAAVAAAEVERRYTGLSVRLRDQ